MLINLNEIEYRQFYMCIRDQPVKAPPRKIKIDKVTGEQLSYFPEKQFFVTLHPDKL
jgi:hypothetical protein